MTRHAGRRQPQNRRENVAGKTHEWRPEHPYEVFVGVRLRGKTYAASRVLNELILGRLPKKRRKVLILEELRQFFEDIVLQAEEKMR